MTPDVKARMYFISAVMGGLASIGFAAAVAFGWPDFVRGLFVGMMLVGLLVILWRRLRDEYMQGLWQAGTSAAFATVVVLTIFGPLLLGIAEGVTGGFDASTPPDFKGEYVGIAAILAFYAGFHLAWLRGAR